MFFYILFGGTFLVSIINTGIIYMITRKTCWNRVTLCDNWNLFFLFCFFLPLFLGVIKHMITQWKAPDCISYPCSHLSPSNLIMQENSVGEEMTCKLQACLSLNWKLASCWFLKIIEMFQRSLGRLNVVTKPSEKKLKKTFSNIHIVVKYIMFSVVWQKWHETYIIYFLFHKMYKIYVLKYEIDVLTIL